MPCIGVDCCEWVSSLKRKKEEERKEEDVGEKEK